jgi:hypothetical protein
MDQKCHVGPGLWSLQEGSSSLIPEAGLVLTLGYLLGCLDFPKFVSTYLILQIRSKLSFPQNSLYNRGHVVTRSYQRNKPQGD